VLATATSSYLKSNCPLTKSLYCEHSLCAYSGCLWPMLKLPWRWFKCQTVLEVSDAKGTSTNAGGYFRSLSYPALPPKAAFPLFWPPLDPPLDYPLPYSAFGLNRKRLYRLSLWRSDWHAFSLGFSLWEQALLWLRLSFGGHRSLKEALGVSGRGFLQSKRYYHKVRLRAPLGSSCLLMRAMSLFSWLLSLLRGDLCVSDASLWQAST